MAFLHLKRSSLKKSSNIFSNFLPQSQDRSHGRNFHIIKSQLNSNYQVIILHRLIHITKNCLESTKNNLTFDSGSIIQFPMSDEIHFYRNSRNNFTQMSFSDTKESYGPPLAILLPWQCLDENILKKFIEIYGEKGFDVITVSLTARQMMFPCESGGAMNIITEFLEYLEESHKHRPYIFHGFSVGVYVYGEIMAQFSDQYDKFKIIMNNVKGCLWDSPVDFMTVKPHIGRAFYPKSWFKRWRCNRTVKKHFKEHCHDSVLYWLRSRDNFCNPVIKVPNIFFVSCNDLLSNPNSLQPAQKMLECNGVPVFQKSWWDSQHTYHYDKYCYEYMYGMLLFFNMSDLYPDESGKYRSGSASPSLNNVRLQRKAREEICQLRIDKS